MGILRRCTTQSVRRWTFSKRARMHKQSRYAYGRLNERAALLFFQEMNHYSLAFFYKYAFDFVKHLLFQEQNL